MMFSVQTGDEGGVQADGNRHALAGLLNAVGHAQPLRRAGSGSEGRRR